MPKKKKLPIYEMTVDQNSESGVEMTALVDNPAVEMDFLVFDEQKPMQFKYDDKEWIVTGVAMRADYPIYRNDSRGEYYVTFSKETIKTIIKKHNAEDVANGVYLIESIFVDKNRGVNAPEGLDVEDGSWIHSYYVENPEIRAKIEAGEFKGFSVEGMFGMEFGAHPIDDVMKDLNDTIDQFLNNL
jgi:hypothetical protein